MGERDGARRQASVRVDGAKSLRRSRWERGACERVARGRARAKVGGDSARVGVHEDQTMLAATQKAGGFLQRLVYIGTGNAEETREPAGSSRECEGCGQRKRWI